MIKEAAAPAVILSFSFGVVPPRIQGLSWPPLRCGPCRRISCTARDRSAARLCRLPDCRKAGAIACRTFMLVRIRGSLFHLSRSLDGLGWQRVPRTVPCLRETIIDACGIPQRQAARAARGENNLWCTSAALAHRAKRMAAGGFQNFCGILGG